MFDFVIVGAGSAGCVLANRLSADPKRKVALIEAGGAHHKTFNVRVPGAWPELWRSSVDWGLSTEPQAHSDQRRHYWPRGKLLGGTSCLNAMVYIRGHRDNYDGWRDLGNPGWGYADVLPLFKKSEDNARGASEFHGTGGGLHVDDHPVVPVCKAFVEAVAARCKVPVTDDFNASQQEGAGIYQHTARNGLRASTAVCFLDPIRSRDNLTVLTDAHATSLVLDGDRVTGVRIRVRGSEQVIEGREIIVAGGSIGSPQLLLLSGIGPAAELREVGIDGKHELAGVGKHLEDHLCVPMMYEVTGAHSLSLAKHKLLWWALKHLVSRSGPLALPAPPAGGFVKSKPDAPRPDIQFHMTPFGWPFRPNSDEPRDRTFGRYASMAPGLIYPRSHGEIRLRSADPMAAPLIDPKYFSDPADLEHLVDGVKLTREIAATSPLKEMVGAEAFPGPSVASDDELRAYVRQSAQTIFHPTGTCKMGTDAMAVVDPELRVRGLRGLRVADASIMPRIVGGNTNAPTIMIAEKCAELALA
ncbi:MAG TPA: GMC family oxidoreductase N-terminal domain-containing protein [Kofleriaceae bacterium]